MGATFVSVKYIKVNHLKPCIHLHKGLEIIMPRNRMLPSYSKTIFCTYISQFFPLLVIGVGNIRGHFEKQQHFDIQHE